MFANRSLKFRLFAVIYTVVILYTGISGYMLYVQRHLQSMQDHGSDLFKESQEIAKIIEHANAVYPVLGDSVINRKFDETVKNIKELRDDMEKDLKVLQKLSTTPEEAKELESITKDYRRYLDIFEHEFLPEVMKNEQLTIKARGLDEEADQLRDRLFESLNRFDGWLHEAASKGDQEFDDTAHRSMYISLGLGLIVLIFSTFYATSFGNSIAQVLSSVTDSVSELAGKLLHSASELTDATHELSEANSEQAAAIQETSATMAEISAMVEKSSGNAESSAQLARESSDSASRGEEASHKMIQSVEEIKSSQNQIARQVQDSNQKIAEIVRIINDIGAKTKVINEIVFQTKLLSFNASVEAARAGEHGKGFAVVAEEVGSLAQMSGNAAKEISALLESSIQTVNQTISESQGQIESILRQGEMVVQQGTEIARETGDQLQRIAKGIAMVTDNSNSIAQATKEQTIGVGQVSEALSQLDKATHQNASVAKQVSVSATEVNDFSVDLSKNMENLKQLIYGQSA